MPGKRGWNRMVAIQGGCDFKLMQGCFCAYKQTQPNKASSRRRSEVLLKKAASTAKQLIPAKTWNYIWFQELWTPSLIAVFSPCPRLTANSRHTLSVLKIGSYTMLRSDSALAFSNIFGSVNSAESEEIIECTNWHTHTQRTHTRKTHSLWQFLTCAVDQTATELPCECIHLHDNWVDSIHWWRPCDAVKSSRKC